MKMYYTYSSINDDPMEYLTFAVHESLGALHGTHRFSAQSHVCNALSNPALAKLLRLPMRILYDPQFALLFPTTCQSLHSLLFRSTFSSTHQPTMMFLICMVCIDHNFHAGRTLKVSRWPL